MIRQWKPFAGAPGVLATEREVKKSLLVFLSTSSLKPMQENRNCFLCHLRGDKGVEIGWDRRYRKILSSLEYFSLNIDCYPRHCNSVHLSLGKQISVLLPWTLCRLQSQGQEGRWVTANLTLKMWLFFSIWMLPFFISIKCLLGKSYLGHGI